MELLVNNNPVYVATGGKDFDASLPAVMFIHGSGGDHRTWALQTRWFAYHGYSVLAPDLPGHSLSGGEAFQSIEESGPWLEKFLDRAGVTQVHIVGHSQGFLSALEFSKSNADKVLSLTAVGTAAAIPVNQALIDTAKDSAANAAHMMVNWGFGPAAHMGMSSVPGMQPLAICRAIMSANPLAADLQACADYSGGAAIAKSLSFPRHCILATHDKMTPVKAGKALAADMNCEVSIIDGYGHMLPLEAPKKTLAAIKAFIESVENQRAAA
jgi:pimeloyl-ACP methyl ester carboxylesterase